MIHPAATRSSLTYDNRLIYLSHSLNVLRRYPSGFFVTLSVTEYFQGLFLKVSLSGPISCRVNDISPSCYFDGKYFCFTELSLPWRLLTRL